MVTVRLSEPPSLTVVTQSMAMSEQQQDGSGEDIPLHMPDSIDFSALALVILSLAVNLLGDWLRDALNPKLR